MCISNKNSRSKERNKVPLQTKPPSKLFLIWPSPTNEISKEIRKHHFATLYYDQCYARVMRKPTKFVCFKQLQRDEVMPVVSLETVALSVN